MEKEVEEEEAPEVRILDSVSASTESVRASGRHQPTPSTHTINSHHQITRAIHTSDPHHLLPTTSIHYLPTPSTHAITIHQGDLTALMGPSGSGKTTLLDILADVRTTGRATGGVFINGRPIRSMAGWLKRNAAYVIQSDDGHYPDLTVREQLTFAAFLGGVASKSMRSAFQAVEQCMADTGLAVKGDVKIGKATGGGLSGGQKRRLSVAMALIRAPSLLLLDEPTSGLDSAAALELVRLLSRISASGRCVVCTIHQPRPEAFALFSKVGRSVEAIR